MSRIIYIEPARTPEGEIIPPPTPVQPSIILNAIDTITTTTFDFGATVTSDGGSTITNRGVRVYADAGFNTVVTDWGNYPGTTGYYGFRVHYLTPNTTYWIKAYAVNVVGETVSNAIQITTLSNAVIPTVTVTSIFDITSDSAKANCVLTSDGGDQILASGVCWGLVANPTITGSKTTDGGSNEWNSSLSGLALNTTYHIRAYATNSVGTAYSADYSFTTDSWTLLLEFQSNFPSGKVFPMNIITSTGEYKLDLGDGTILLASSSSHTYSSTMLRTVRLYGKGVCTISRAYLYGCNIVGELNLSHDAFKTCVNFEAYTNTELTNLVLPPVVTGTVQTIGIALTAFSGVLDLGAITSFSTSLRLYLAFSQITGISFASSISGKLEYVSGWNCNFTGTLDFSKFQGLTNNFSFDFNTNPALTQVIFPSCTAICTRLVVANAELSSVNLTSVAGLTNKNGSGLNFSNNNMTVSEVNKLLTDIDAVSVSGYTNRSLYVAGGNAFPDTTSGGYNGLASAQSLVAKGFIIDLTL